MSGLTRPRLSWQAIVGIILVPLTISGLFIWGLWSPTERLRTVEAAVVNLDEPVTIDGQYTPLGRVFAGALIGDSKVADDETNFTWHLTNEADAEAGLDEGRYATVVTIPENFSAAATSGGDPATAEQATIDIATSDRGRLIDSALSNVVTSTATRVLNEQLGTAFVDQVFVGMGTLHTSLGEAASGADQLAAGSHQLADGTSSLATGAGALASGAGQLSTGAGALASGLGSFSSGLGEYANGVSALAGGADKAAAGTEQYVAGVGQLVDGLRAALAPITKAIGVAKDAIDSLEIDQTTGLPVGMPDPTTNTTLLGTQLADAQGSLGAAAGGGAQLSGLVTECLASGANVDFCDRLAAATTATNDPVAAAQTQLGAATATQQQLAADAQTTKTVIQNAVAGVAAARPQLDALEAQLNGLDGKLATLAAAGPQVAAGSRGIAGGIGALAVSGHELAGGAGALAGGAGELASGVPALTDGAVQLADGAGKLADGAQQAASGTDELASGLGQAVDGVPSYSEAERDALARAALTPVVATGSGDELFNAAGVPLFTGIALWAGGLAAFLMLSPLWRRTRDAARGLGAITLRSALPGLIAGAAQGALVGIAMPIALGLDAAAFAGFFGFGLLAGVAFALLNQGLAALLGSLGRFLSFLMLVVAFAGGIVSTAPALLRGIADATPIGSAFSGFQSIASGAAGAGSAAMQLVLWALIGLALIGFAAARARKADRAPADETAAVPSAGHQLLPA